MVAEPRDKERAAVEVPVGPRPVLTPQVSPVRPEAIPRPEPAPAEVILLAVSVVLPVLNEQRDIGRLLDEILAQQAPEGGFEVIVADGGSVDRTRDIVLSRCEKSPNLRLIDNPRRLSSAGRNAGARAARGRYVVFLDGHCSLPRQDYLVRLVDIFRSSAAECLCRPQPLQKLAEGKWARAIAMARHSFLGHDPGSDIYGGQPNFTDPRSAGAAYTRVVLETLGGYDERFDACEDVEFNHRVAAAGLRAYRHPDLSVDYRPRRRLRAFFRQMLRYGRGRARLMARHPSTFPLPLVAITIAVLAVPALLGVAGWRVAAGVLVCTLGAWFGLVAFESLRICGPSSQAVRVAAAFFTIHVGLVLGFWRGLLEFSRYRPGRGSFGSAARTPGDASPAPVRRG